MEVAIALIEINPIVISYCYYSPFITHLALTRASFYFLSPTYFENVHY